MTEYEAITKMLAEHNRRTVASLAALDEAKEALAACAPWWIHDRHRLKRLIRKLEDSVERHTHEAIGDLEAAMVNMEAGSDE